MKNGLHNTINKTVSKRKIKTFSESASDKLFNCALQPIHTKQKS